MPALASTEPGTEIRNTATGSFEDPNNLGEVYEVNSNEVVLTVTEVAGITVVPSGTTEAPGTVANAGPNQNNGTIEAQDVVYFEYTITNVGNDPTQFFIPGTPSEIIGGSQSGEIQIIGYDPDGPNGTDAAVDLSAAPVTVPSGGLNTGDTPPSGLGLPNGSLSPQGTVTVRIPIKIDAGTNVGDTVSVVLGDTGPNDNSANTQNQVYSDNGSNQDLYTQDNGDGTVTNEADGTPANGDGTFHRQEASAKQSLVVGGTHTISGNLFQDYGLGTAGTVGNDDLDLGEQGLPNVTVSLYEDTDGNGSFDATIDTIIGSAITTDALGDYQFTGLADGDYFVAIDTADTDLGSLTYGGGDADTTQINPRPVTINGGNEENVDFPFDAPTAALTGVVWQDADSDGIKESGETPVPFTQVNLYDTNGTPGDNSDDTLVGSTFTDSMGAYIFNNLDPSRYYVDFVQPSGAYTFTPADRGADDFVDSDANAVTGETHKFDVTAGTTTTGVDAGLVLPTNTVVMCVTVSPLQTMNWSNSVGLPKFDPALGALTQVDLQMNSHLASRVDYSNTTASASTITVTPNSSVSVTLPDSSTLTNNSHSSAAIYDVPAGASVSGATLNHVDSDGVATVTPLSAFEATTAGQSETLALTLTANTGTETVSGGSATVTQQSFKASLCATYTYTSYQLSGNVFEDYDSGNASRDGNDVLDNNEAGIKFVSVNLYRDNGDNVFDPATDTLVKTVETDANGDYLFTEVGNGDFWIQTDTGDADLGVRGYGGGDVDNSQVNPRPITVNNASQADINFPFDAEKSDPNVLLVKRITAINGGMGTVGTADSLTGHIDDPNNDYDDNTLASPAPDPLDTDQWPTPLNNTLRGGINGGNVQPNDEIEYTIYYLSAGGSAAENVRFCDYVPDFSSFIPNAFAGNTPASGGLSGADLGIRLLRDGVDEYHTGANDGDSATYFAPGTDPASSFPGIDCEDDGDGINANPNGAVVVDLGNLPSAATDANGAYGYVQFRVRVE
ncbi:MAG: SdrD B-like domain-containing protein [Cyanobacteria bacterium J06626_26]